MNLQEKTLTCQDCRKPFAFTAEEQKFHAQKGYTNTPKRCPQCRCSRRSEQDHTSSRVPDHNSSRVNSGRPSGNMSPVPCARCGASTKVLVQPAAGRHVYCSSCYSKQPAYSRTY